MKKYILFIICLLLTGCTSLNFDKNIENGYIDSSKCEISMIQDWQKYEVYKYDSSHDEKFINSDRYVVVDDNNIDEIVELFNYMEDTMKDTKCAFTFDYSSISNGNYVRIERPEQYYTELQNDCNVNDFDDNHCYYMHDFVVYLYDINSHILYKIENNT